MAEQHEKNTDTNLLLLLRDTSKALQDITITVAAKEMGYEEDEIQLLVDWGASFDSSALFTWSNKPEGIFQILPYVHKAENKELDKLFKDFQKQLPLLKERLIPYQYRKKAMEILKNGSPLEYVAAAVDKSHKGDAELKYLYYLSGLMLGVKSDLIHISAVGTSGKGKSDLSHRVGCCYPPHMYHYLQDLSPKSIQFAVEAGKLKGKSIVIVDEAEVAKEGIPTLRALTSSETGAKARNYWTVKDMEFLDIRLDGKIVVWLNSVDPVDDPQLNNRFIMANVDESKELDKLVHEHQKKRYGYGKEGEELLEEFKIIRAMSEILLEGEDNVVIPYIEQVVWGGAQNRRNFPIFLLLVKACTKVHMFQRETTSKGDVLATREDFDIARAIWESVIKTQATKVDNKCIEIMDYLPPSEDAAKTRAEITQALGIPTGTLRDKVDGILVPAGLVNSKKEENRWYYWKGGTENLRLPTAQVDWGSFGEKELQAFFEEYLRDCGGESSTLPSNLPSLLNKINKEPTSPQVRKWIGEHGDASISEIGKDASAPQESAGGDDSEVIIETKIGSDEPYVHEPYPEGIPEHPIITLDKKRRSRYEQDTLCTN